jgi:hypothetical protein
MKIQIQTRNLKNDSSISAVHGEHSTSRAQNPFASLLTLALILSTFGLCSCVGLTSANSGKPGSSAGLLSSSSTSVSFGNVTVGKGKMQSVTITNTGSATVNVSKTKISGTGYSIVNGASMTTIAPGATSTVQIQMIVHGPGTNNGRYTLESDAQNSPLDINLTGTGVASELSLSPSSLNFGNVKVGQSATQNVTLSNSGNVDLVVSAAQVMGSGFAVSGLTLPATITAGQSTSFTVQFTPTAAQGGTGSIQFMDNASDSPQTFDLAGTGTSANTTLSANPGSIAFGSVAVGNSASQSVTLTNTGASTIAISQAVASGTGFSINGLSSMNLAVGQSTSFAAKFSPASAGGATGTVTITSNATNSTLTIAMIGTGTLGQLTASPSSVNFGSVQVGNNSSVSVSLTNTGTANVLVSSGSASGNGFSISGLSAATLAPGQSTSFTATFAPTSAGSALGSISIASNAPGSPLNIVLSGSATEAQPQVALSPANVAFGNVALGASASQSASITNIGSGALTISSVTPSGSGFSFAGLGAQTINAGASVSFAVKFSPVTSGNVTGGITIVSNAANSPSTLVLSGSGVQGQLAASPSSANFGTVSTGNSDSQTITLTNGGAAAVSITQANVSGNGFSLSGMPALPLTINPSGSSTFNVVFAPTTSGNAIGSISLVSNAPNSPLSIALSGTGQTATQLLSANPSSLNFSNVNDGSSSSLTVTLTNNGNSNVTIASATASGTGFSASGAAGTTLTPNQAATVTVTFAPTSAGAATGSLTIASNASNSPTITLAGTGVQQTSHTVSVTWTASVSTDVVGYNVYRGTVSGGPYSILDSTPVTADAYSDSTVQGGQTFYYVVRSVDNTGIESVNSTEVQAIIP